MQKQTYVVIVKMAYKYCPVRSRPVGVFAPDDVIGLFISDLSTRKDVENGITKICLSVGGGRNVRAGSLQVMERYMQAMKPLLDEKYGTNYELDLQPASRPKVLF